MPTDLASPLRSSTEPSESSPASIRGSQSCPALTVAILSETTPCTPRYATLYMRQHQTALSVVVPR
jgi:hypothetical protein